MIEILSLPRRNNIDVVQFARNVRFNSGLPINSLPGWENIPLNSKLPMLKCPDNQVIFSKNKIGQSVSATLKHLKQEFDTSGRDCFPEYNPLHDSNLKTFYANERNLKRLRENGEITQNNDVICNLKDFNEYRLQLHKSQLYYILQELNRQEAEQHDRMLISNAEAITHRDHSNISARQHSYTEILQRKRKLDQLNSLRYQKLLQKTEDKFARIATIQAMKKAFLESKKLLNDLKMQHHWEVRSDLQRKHLIMLKKLFQFKKDRLKKNMKLNNEKRANKLSSAQVNSWDKRMNERIANQGKIKQLIDDLAKKKKSFIENHRNQYNTKWLRIQNDIIARSRNMSAAAKDKHKRKRRRRKPRELEKRDTVQSSYTVLFENLADKDLAEALKTSVDLGNTLNLPFDNDDPIYKVAKFIITNIIQQFDKDLSNDRLVHKAVAKRIAAFFTEAQKFVTYRATQIIANARDIANKKEEATAGSFDSQSLNSEVNTRRRSSRLSKVVSFSNLCSTIGVSSYEINPLISLQSVADRAPTPVGSLASLVLETGVDEGDGDGDGEGDSEGREQQDKNDNNKTNKIKHPPHLTQYEVIYIEHNIIKFKRELIVGIGRRVFSAIQCHFENKIMDVRKELLDMDQKYLVNDMASAILSNAINSLNMESGIKLCISVLSSEIIWNLQKQLLRPSRDPRGIVPPFECCPREAEKMKICQFCE